MATSESSLKKPFFYACFAITFAVALQMQVTLFSSTDYLGLRVNLADFILPFAGVFILSNLLMGKTFWPTWQGHFCYWTIALPSAAIILSILIGYFNMGEWSRWAVLNKGTGWLVLLAYLGAGAWLSTNAPHKISEIFRAAFIGFFCLTAAYEFLTHFLYWELGVPLPFPPGAEVKGLMFNRNAFAFLFLSVAVFIGSRHLSESKPPALNALYVSFWLTAPFCLLMNDSRTLWLCALSLLIWICLKHKLYFLKVILPALIIGTTLVALAFQNAPTKRFLAFHYTALFFETSEERDDYALENKVDTEYDHVRISVFNEAYEAWREAPFTGSGLGTILYNQREEHQEHLTVLDNTLLWVLIEMGPFGLFSFVLLYIVMLHTLYKNRASSAFHEAGVFLMLVFGIFSLFHEILYTRFFWFILGMALVVPKEPLMQKEREA